MYAVIAFIYHPYLIATIWCQIFHSHLFQEELKRFKKEYGDLNVPLNKEQPSQLNAWIRTQKQQYKLLHEGKPNHMSQARIDLLNDIGFEWAGERRDKFWHDRYNELVAFHAKHGSTRIPEKYEESPQLHTWVSLQRRQLKMCKEGKPTKLTEERIRLLEAVGLESNIRNSSTWMDRFVCIQEKHVSFAYWITFDYISQFFHALQYRHYNRWNSNDTKTSTETATSRKSGKKIPL